MKDQLYDSTRDQQIDEALGGDIAKEFFEKYAGEPVSEREYILKEAHKAVNAVLAEVSGIPIQRRVTLSRAARDLAEEIYEAASHGE